MYVHICIYVIYMYVLRGRVRDLSSPSYMPGTIPTCPVCYFIESLQQFSLGLSVVLPASHVWKQRHKEIMRFPQGHLAAKWQSLDLNQTPLVPKADVLPSPCIGSLRNNWHRHPWFPSIGNELECYYVNVLHVHLSLTLRSHSQSTNSKYHVGRSQDGAA